MDLVFNYGPAMPGAHCARVSKAYLQNYARAFAGAPAQACAVPACGGRLYGSVSRVGNEALAEIDARMAGYERRRKLVFVDGRRAMAWVYFRLDTEYARDPTLGTMRAIRRMLDRCQPSARRNLMIRRFDHKKLTDVGLYHVAKDSLEFAPRR